MRYAMRWAAMAAIGAALAPLAAGAGPQPVNMINGIGLIDYSHRRPMPIGSWVKYHVTGSSELGMEDDYTVTILIGGEERFWGEDCFWVETWTEIKGQPPSSVASLMSYAIFDDSLAIPNLQLYNRKVVSEVDEQGNPIQVVTKRNAGSLKGRIPSKERVLWTVDSLGSEVVTTPKGSFPATKILMKQGIGSTADVGDSSIRTEVRENRTIYMASGVPITGIVREDIHNRIERKTWRIGESQNAPMRVMEDAKGVALVVDFGTGLTPQLVPERFRKPLSAAAPAGAPSRPKPAARKKTG